MTSDDFESVVDSGDISTICNAMVDLSFDSKTDFDWFEERCVELLAHADGSVRALSATCLSHTARFKGALEEKTVAALRALENDPLIGGQVSDALDDWEQFAGGRRKPQE
jgi:hypothetical protein